MSSAEIQLFSLLDKGLESLTGKEKLFTKIVIFYIGMRKVLNVIP